MILSVGKIICLFGLHKYPKAWDLFDEINGLCVKHCKYCEKPKYGQLQYNQTIKRIKL